MIKLIATDLDGTVLGPDFRFRDRTLEALRAARSAGLEIVYVTGRPHRWIEPVREQLEYDSVAICSNGAVIFDVARDEVIEAETVDAEVILDLRARLGERLPHASYSVETLAGAYSEEGWPDTNLKDAHRRTVGPLHRSLPADAQIIKFLVRDDSMDPRELFEVVRRVGDESVSVTHAVADLPLAEAGQPGLSKGRTLARWCEAEGISAEEVLAFGDMPNDTSMLQWAGHGYAMASGWPGVIEEVGRTCPGFDDDGVAQVIERVLAGD